MALTKADIFESITDQIGLPKTECTEIFENRSKGSKVMTFFVDKK